MSIKVLTYNTVVKHVPSPEEPAQQQYGYDPHDPMSVFFAPPSPAQPAPPLGYYQPGDINDPYLQLGQIDQQGLSLRPVQPDPQPGPSNTSAAAQECGRSTTRSSGTISPEGRKADIKERNRRSQAKSRAKKVEQARLKDERIECLEAEVGRLQAENARERQCMDRVMHCVYELAKERPPPPQLIEAMMAYHDLGKSGSS